MRNYLLITLIFVITACGYSPITKDIKNQNIYIYVNNTTGNIEMNNLINNQLKLYSNKNSKNIFNIDFKTDYKKISITKDSAGITTDYKLLLDVEFFVKNKEINKKFQFQESLNIKNTTTNFQQTDYEKTVKRNFASSIKEKLILKLMSIK